MIHLSTIHGGISNKFVHFSLLFFVFQNCYARDISTITPTQNITDAQTLTSAGRIFKLGFFSPPNSTNRYVGIWYEFDPRTIVWVANRNKPLKDSSGTLRIAEDGNLVVSDGRGVVFWTTNVFNITTPSNSVAELFDSGNLEFRLLNNVVWRSFDHPTDTFLPGMNIGGSKIRGKKLELTSWKSESDPSTGIFSAGLELLDDKNPQLVIWRNGSNSRFWRSGPWNGIVFIGIAEMSYAQSFSLSEDNMYISYKDPDNLKTQFALDHHGAFHAKEWDADLNNWNEFWSSQSNSCGIYATCGPFGSCNPSNLPICSCLVGFRPKFEDEWSKGNWSGGCVRITQLECQDSGFGIPDTVDGFQKLESIKVPDYAVVSSLLITELDDCRTICLRNCSCLAYSYDSGIGCITWDRNLVDIQNFTQRGSDLYIRLAHSDIVHGLSKSAKLVIVIAALVGTLAVSICTYLYWKWLTKQR
ncbi:hypothetical protein MKX03_025808, partial [Papaver bracteatum]